MSAPDAPRAPARLILTTPEHLIAHGLGTGLSPVAPGTVGTLLGIPLFLLLMGLSPALYAAACALLFVFGCWVCGESARLLRLDDAPGIVFDEVVGYLMAALPLLPALGWVSLPLWAGLLAAFLLFRLFDILKPWPIRWLDRHVEGGFGIMVDDAMAGVFAAASLLLITRLLPTG